ncbi:cob(II)yrinic acid a,c-diamide reductase [Blastomonas natatoria]|uniref:Cob(II)yrinic acid a,c-diamide reductase n=1 Tax=Blastomonas natatoria TaxID=34015 RepID=A0A2V3VCD4_9SPHN|nr:5,6-dimethylbenzimidazole synthase [Blastomonas natatoria]PXW79377.1 cob(II)yrinic acid a,c-diamide reductase [Blastomonas natatoria]
MTGPVFDATFRASLDQLLAWRRDVRHFQARPLPDGMLDRLLDTACGGPSVGNAQPWRFVHILSSDRRNALAQQVDAEKRAAGGAYDGQRKALYDGLKLHGLREAPEIVAVFCDEHDSAGHGLGRATMPETLCWSVVTAVHTLWLAARAQGIGLGWVSIIDPEGLNMLLDVPAHWRFVALLCLGYPERETETPELVRHGWQERLDPATTRLVR